MIGNGAPAPKTWPVPKMIDFEEMQIEYASVDEAEEILELRKASFRGQAQIYDNYLLPPLVQTIDSIRREFATKSLLRAVFKNQLIASVMYQQRETLVHIERLIVHPAYQNQGVGTHLMRALEGKFHRGVTFRLLTGEKSKRNLHLYTKLGYQVAGKETTDQGIVLSRMEKQT